MGKLFLVSTPIGNLEDITLKAIRILEEVDLIFCEDTRKTGILLNRLKEVKPLDRFNLVAGLTWSKKPRLMSYYEENELGRIPQVIQMLQEGKNIALVSNAGTPTISDPGFKLVRECVNLGLPVESIPGPSAILAALVVSGLPTDKFLFLGFLPRKAGKRIKIFENLKNNLTIVFYESPYRLLETLKDIGTIFGDIQVVVCRELTKIHEEVRREKVSDAIQYFEKTKPQGEFTILFSTVPSTSHPS